MIKLKVAAVAFATGMMTIAVYAQDQMPENPKSLAEKASKKQKEKSETAGKPGVDKATTSSISVAERTDLISSARKEMTGSIGESETYRFGPIVRRYAASYGVPVSLAHAVIQVESNYRADARGSAGEVGLMQIKPATARMMGYSGSVKDLFDPETNIRFGMKYLAKAHQLGGGTTCGTVLKYNAGHAAKRMNPVSAAYCTKVKRQLAGI